VRLFVANFSIKLDLTYRPKNIRLILVSHNPYLQVELNITCWAVYFFLFVFIALRKGLSMLYLSVRHFIAEISLNIIPLNISFLLGHGVQSLSTRYCLKEWILFWTSSICLILEAEPDPLVRPLR